MLAEPFRHRTTGDQVLAMQLTDSMPLDAFVDWASEEEYAIVVSPRPPRLRVHIETTDGESVALVGDWVLRDSHGQFYVLSDDLFVIAYEAVPFPPTTDPRHVEWDA